MTPTTLKIKFINKDQSTFFSTLRTRIDQYFQQTAGVKTGGTGMWYKALFMLSLYLIPYFLLLTNSFSRGALLFFAVLMGLGIAGVGMSVMHDANHGTFSSRSWINRLFSGSLYLLGGNVYNWQIQHNTLHHTYTNIDQWDSDITGKPFLRLSEQQRRRPFHRYQHWYAFLLYGLMTFSFLVKDIRQIREFQQKSRLKITKSFPSQEIAILVVGKLLYLVMIGLIPLLVTDLSFGEWLVGYLVMNFVAGLVLSIIFQVAHVVEGVTPPEINAQGSIENAWAIHQLETTANFSAPSALSWFIGGLDYQIEHHLFPSISHVHYPDIARIVRETAGQYGVRYHQKKSLWHAILSHQAMLKRLGRPDVVPVKM